MNSAGEGIDPALLAIRERARRTRERTRKSDWFTLCQTFADDLRRELGSDYESALLILFGAQVCEPPENFDVDEAYDFVHKVGQYQVGRTYVPETRGLTRTWGAEGWFAEGRADTESHDCATLGEALLTAQRLETTAAAEAAGLPLPGVGKGGEPWPEEGEEVGHE